MITFSMANEEQLKTIATKLIWWQPPEVSLRNLPRFVAQVMTLGNWDEVKTVSASLGWEAFKEALAKAQPGDFDRKSWALWHHAFGQPVPELPKRAFLKEFGL